MLLFLELLRRISLLTLWWIRLLVAIAIIGRILSYLVIASETLAEAEKTADSRAYEKQDHDNWRPKLHSHREERASKREE